MSQRRIVITGLGQVSPVGDDIATAWNNLFAGKSSIGRIAHFDAPDIGSQIADGVRDFNIGQYISAKETRHMDVFIHYGIAAALQAINDSGLDDLETLGKDRVGINIGSGIGNLPSIEATGETILEGDTREINPFFIPGSLINLVSGRVIILKDYHGLSYGMVSACTAGARSIGDSARLIKYNDADVMIAGGAESAISTLNMGGFAAMKTLSIRNDDPVTASCPWDKGRDGFVIGEGAGVLVLEELGHAKKRDAKIYTKIIGFGMSSDAYHITTSSEEGPALTVIRALRDTGPNPEDVDYVNTHGASTPLDDANETKTLKRALGDHTHEVIINSTKSMTGHLLDMAGDVEALHGVLMAHEQKSPPTISIFEQNVEAGCDLDYCANETHDAKIDVVIFSSFGFGDTNGASVFKRFAG